MAQKYNYYEKFEENDKINELSIEDIKKLIPHRYPFLLIDKLIDIVPQKSAVGVKNVTFNENFFKVISSQCQLCLVL